MKKRETVNYFDCFIKSSEYALDAARILRDYIHNFDGNRSKEMEDRVHSLENEADHNQHVLLNYLITDFLPPLDREDIVTLAHSIDDMVDDIDDIVINLDMLNVEVIRPDVMEFVDLLERCCVDVNEMFVKLKNMKKFEEVKERVIEINKLEDEGDVLYQRAIKNLYMNEINAIEVIRWSKLYKCIEDCFDACEGIADCVEEILMKNS